MALQSTRSKKSRGSSDSRPSRSWCQPIICCCPAANALPALIVVRRPPNVTHFVVTWRRHGQLVQVMDPRLGAGGVPARRFIEELFVHSMPVPAAGLARMGGLG